MNLGFNKHEIVGAHFWRDIPIVCLKWDNWDILGPKAIYLNVL